MDPADSTSEAPNQLAIAPGVVVHESLLRFRFVRARGPGGQNVNKVSSAAELRVSMEDLAKVMPLDAISRLKTLAGSKLTLDGELLFFADDSRTQEQNRAEAIRRLRELVVEAMKRPKARRKSKPSRASKQRRLDSKKRRSNIKANRGGEWS